MKTVEFRINLQIANCTSFHTIEKLYDAIEKAVQDSEITGDYSIKTIIG